MYYPDTERHSWVQIVVDVPTLDTLQQICNERRWLMISDVIFNHSPAFINGTKLNARIRT